MIKISKIDAFTLVIQAMEKGDTKTANEMLKIIQKSISKEKRNTFDATIELEGKKEQSYFKSLIKETKGQES